MLACRQRRPCITAFLAAACTLRGRVVVSLLPLFVLLVACGGPAETDPPDDDLDDDGYLNEDDCEPENAAVHPGAAEVCDNALDDDCDGGADACRLPELVPPSALGSVDLEDGEDFVDYTLASIGDADGDGRREILVGVPDRSDGEGRLYVLASSQPLPAAISGAWATIDGLAEGAAKLGGAVAGVGDLDGDGREDWIARVSQKAATFEGYYSVLGFGSPAAGAVDASSALVHWESDSGQLGHFIAGGGDITGDGRPDVAMSHRAQRTEDGDPVALLLVFGPPTSAAESDALVSLFEDESTSLTRYVTSVLAQSDLDGDGLDDLVVGASRNDGAGTDQGDVLLFSGPVLGHIFLEGADRSVRTGLPEETSGPLVFEGGDLDANGTDDLVVADPVADSDREVYLLTAFWPEAIEDASAKIAGGANSRSLGRCAAGLGDVDGDGAVDLLVTDPNYSGEGVVGAEGAAYLFYGPVVGSLSIESAGFSSTGDSPDQRLGDQCAAIGDWNGDGHRDFGFTSDPGYPYPDTSRLFFVFGAGI